MEMTQSTNFSSTDDNNTLVSTISESLEIFFASNNATTSDEEVSILALWCGF